MPAAPHPQTPDGPSSPRDGWEQADPAPGDRRRIAWAVGGLVLGLSAIHMLAVRPTMAWVRTLPDCDQATWLSGMLVGTMALMPLFCLIVLVPIGFRVWRHGCWPYPGVWLWRRTRVRRGWRARLTSVGMFVCTVITVPMPLFTWQIVSPLMDRACQKATAPAPGSTP